MDRVSKMGCLVCGRTSTLHHVTGDSHAPGRLARSHKRVAPLCPVHHQKVHDPKAGDPVSVEGLGHRKFYQKYGIDLLAVADQLWDETCELG